MGIKFVSEKKIDPKIKKSNAFRVSDIMHLLIQDFTIPKDRIRSKLVCKSWLHAQQTNTKHRIMEPQNIVLVRFAMEKFNFLTEAIFGKISLFDSYFKINQNFYDLSGKQSESKLRKFSQYNYILSHNQYTCCIERQ